MSSFMAIYGDALFPPLVISCMGIVISWFLCGERLMARSAFAWGVCVATNVAIHFLLAWICFVQGQADYPRFLKMVCYFMQFIWLSVASRQGLYQRATIAVLSVTITSMGSSLAVVFSAGVFGENLFYAGPLAMRWLLNIALLGLELAFAAFIRSIIAEGMQHVERPVQLAMIFLFVLPFNIAHDYYGAVLRGSPVGLVQGFAFICGVAGLAGICSQMHAIARDHQNERLLIDQVSQRQKDQYRAVKEQLDAVAKVRHDLKHILSGLRTMDDIGEIHRYIDSLNGQVTGIERINHTGHLTVDIALSEALRKCREEGVRFTTSVNGALWSHVADADIAVMWGNALDNAVEAACAASLDANRWVEVRSTRVKDMLVTTFCNGFNHGLRQKGKRLLTTKREGGHGYGLASIQQVVESYHGKIAVRAEDEVFTVTIIIPVERPSV